MRDDMTIKLTQKLPVIIRKDLTSSLQPDLVVMPTLHHMYYVKESMVNVLWLTFWKMLANIHVTETKLFVLQVMHYVTVDNTSLVALLLLASCQ